MPTPDLVSLEKFPSKLTLKRTGSEKVSDANTSKARVSAALGGKIVVRFSLKGTNLAFDAKGKKELTASDMFAAGTTKAVPIRNWAIHCPKGTVPNPLIALNVTAEYDGEQPSGVLSAMIDIVDAPPL